MAVPVHAVALVRKDDDSQTVEIPSVLFHDLDSGYTITNAKVAMTVDSFANGKFSGALNCYADRLSGSSTLSLFGSAVTSINFPALAALEDNANIYFASNPLLASSNFSNLASISDGGALILSYNDLLEEISFVALVAMQGHLEMNNNARLNTLHFPALVLLDDNLSAEENVLLASVSLPALTTIVAFASLSFRACSALTQFSFDALTSVGNGAYINLINCALTESVVNAILVKVNAAHQGNGTLDLSGGTNAPPSGAGLTAQSDLEDDGWTVNVN